MAARSVASMSIGDYSRETAVMTVNIVTPTDNDYSTVITQFGTFQSAILAVSRGLLRQSNINRIAPTQAGWPSDEEAQREDKWLVTVKDNLEWLDAPTNTIPNPGFGKLFDYEIPCADRSAVTMTPGSDIVDHTIAPMDDVATQTAIFVRSPYGGGVTVQEVKFVGRNT